MSAILGKDCKLYYGAASAALSTLTELAIVKNVKIDLDGTDVDVSSRASGGFKEHAVALKDLKLTFDLVKKPSDTDYMAITNAWLTGTALCFAAMSGPKSGGVNGADGFRATFNVSKIGEDQPLEGQVVNSVECTLVAFHARETVAPTTP